jgi:hypothetical protein
VSGPTQWTLHFSIKEIIFEKPLVIQPSVSLEWWGNEERDKMAFLQNKHTMKYDIKCSPNQFENYCKDLSGLKFVFQYRKDVIGHCKFNDFSVLSNPPHHICKLDIFNGKKIVGVCVLQLRIEMVKSNTLHAIRSNPSKLVKSSKKSTEKKELLNSINSSRISNQSIISQENENDDQRAPPNAEKHILEESCTADMFESPIKRSAESIDSDSSRSNITPTSTSSSISWPSNS